MAGSERFAAENAWPGDFEDHAEIRRIVFDCPRDQRRGGINMRLGIFRICAMSVLAILAPGAARAQQPGEDPLGQSFFPPELVIQHQEAIGLSPEQKDAFKAEIRQAQLKFTELQWKLQDEME